METSVQKFLRLVKQAQTRGLNMAEAVYFVMTQDKMLALDVLEDIGSWPSSEPELAYLQKHFW